MPALQPGPRTQPLEALVVHWARLHLTEKKILKLVSSWINAYPSGLWTVQGLISSREGASFPLSSSDMWAISECPQYANAWHSFHTPIPSQSILMPSPLYAFLTVGWSSWPLQFQKERNWGSEWWRHRWRLLSICLGVLAGKWSYLSSLASAWSGAENHLLIGEGRDSGLVHTRWPLWNRWLNVSTIQLKPGNPRSQQSSMISAHIPPIVLLYMRGK